MVGEIVDMKQVMAPMVLRYWSDIDTRP